MAPGAGKVRKRYVNRPFAQLLSGFVRGHSFSVAMETYQGFLWLSLITCSSFSFTVRRPVACPLANKAEGSERKAVCQDTITVVFLHALIEEINVQA